MKIRNWLAIAIIVFLTGCKVKRDTSLRSVQVNASCKATIYQTYGRDEADLVLKVETSTNEARCFLLKHSSYDGFSAFQLRMLYLAQTERIWIIIDEKEQGTVTNSYSILTGEFVDKYGKLLNPSSSLKIVYPEYGNGEVPSVPSNAVEVANVAYPGD